MTRDRRPGGVPAIAAIVSLGLLVACGRRDIKLLPSASDGATGPKADGATADGGPSAAACVGLGPPARLVSGGRSACASTIAARGHVYALCACGSLRPTARIRTDAFDSSAPAAIDGTSAAIGVNGGLRSIAEVRAGGAIHVAGAEGVYAYDHLESGRSLRVAGPLSMLASRADVGGDAYVGGAISGGIRVNGVLHVPAATVLASDAEAASIVREPVTVAAPCPCDASFAIVSAAIVAAAAQNDNASASLGGLIAAPPGSPTTVSLPCGTYHVSGIDAYGPLSLAVHGRALLAVSGDVVLRAGLTITLDAGAELDLVVGGGFRSSGQNTIGNTTRPAAFRVWMAGSQSMVLDDRPVVGAAIHAPTANVSAGDGFELFGALLAAGVTGDEIQIHYDRALLAGGEACGVAALPSPP